MDSSDTVEIASGEIALAQQLLLIVLCALQSLIIALVHVYGLSSLRWVQPLTASLVPPIAWLVFRISGRAGHSPGLTECTWQAPC